MPTAAPTMYKMESADMFRKTVGSGSQPSIWRQMEQMRQSLGQSEVSSQLNKLFSMSSSANKQLQPAFDKNSSSISVILSHDRAKSQIHKFSYVSHWKGQRKDTKFDQIGKWQKAQLFNAKKLTTWTSKSSIGSY